MGSDLPGPGCMSGSATLEIPSELETARRFLQALHDGRVLDALDAFAPDAVIREDGAREHRGLRAIALSLLPYREAGRVDIIGLHRSTQGVTALLRAHTGLGEAFQEFRATFRISGSRIHSLHLQPS